MSVFKDKVLLITGGTGSFGNAVLRRFLFGENTICNSILINQTEEAISAEALCWELKNIIL